jgi:hypothetical protein
MNVGLAEKIKKFEDDYEESPGADRKRQIMGNIRMTLNRDQIMTFVSGLHETQMELIEAVVYSRERQGFPEATAVIQHIMEKK